MNKHQWIKWAACLVLIGAIGDKIGAETCTLLLNDHDEASHVYLVVNDEGTAFELKWYWLHYDELLCDINSDFGCSYKTYMNGTTFDPTIQPPYYPWKPWGAMDGGDPIYMECGDNRGIFMKVVQKVEYGHRYKIYWVIRAWNDATRNWDAIHDTVTSMDVPE